jgi:hypothetical protein
MRKLILVAVASLAGAGCIQPVAPDAPGLLVSTHRAVSPFAVSEVLRRVSDTPADGQSSSTGRGDGDVEWKVVVRPGKAIPMFETDRTGDYEIHVTVFGCSDASRCQPPRHPHNAIADCFASFRWDGDASAEIMVDLRRSGRCSFRSRGPIDPPMS